MLGQQEKPPLSTQSKGSMDELGLLDFVKTTLAKFHSIVIDNKDAWSVFEYKMQTVMAF